MAIHTRFLSAALAVSLLVTAGCTPSKGKEAEAAAPCTPSPTATVLVTAAPTKTPVPTATPVPDPLLKAWHLTDRDLTLTLQPGGGYEALWHDRSARGSFEAREGLLTLTSSAGLQQTLSYVCDGSTLTLMQRGQEPLVLTAAADSAFTLSPNEAGALSEGLGENAPAIDLVYVNKGVVTVELVPGTAAKDYCMTCLSTPLVENSKNWMAVEGDVFTTFKYDGSYNLFIRDEQGRISDPWPFVVDSGYTYIIRSEGLTSLKTPLEETVAAAGSSVEELNRAVAEDISEAGFYTRMGAITSGVSAVSRMAELGYSIPYQGQGKYQDRDDWGFNPLWGSRLQHPTEDGNGKYYFTGMQCVGSIVWALKQAGLDISNGSTGWDIGRLGELQRSNDNKIKHYQAKSGDFVQVNKHYEMVLDRIDTDQDGEADSFLFYEMMAPHLTFLILTYRNVQGRNWFNMDAMYNNQGRRSDRNRIWVGTSHIPAEDFPDYLQAAQKASDETRALNRFARICGLMGLNENFPTWEDEA
ncbi:MAG: hypothetical protein IJR17_01475 [Clostridia bacterium]|nr:hypothetical protein [Clostridia bacterium]